jgi:hypothetical protein
MTLPHDERSYCSEPGCSRPELGLLRITRNYVRLGHLAEPHPLHPVRLAKPASEHPGVLARTREPNSAPSLEGPPRRTRDGARSEPELSDPNSVVPGATLREHASPPSRQSASRSDGPLPFDDRHPPADPRAASMGAGRPTAGD